MAPRREPITLYDAALATLSRGIEFHVFFLFTCQASYPQWTLALFHKMVSSLPSPLKTKLARKAVGCADTLFERLRLSTSTLQHLVRIFIHENTTAFSIANIYSYQVRQAVINRIGELPSLRAYYNLEHPHENVHTLSILQNLKSLANLREVYLPRWFTDQMAYLLGQSCPNLQVLDACNSHGMTDASVSSLTRCQHLTILNASSTGLSPDGYTKLLQLPHIQKLGYCDSLNAVIASAGTRKSRKTPHTPLALREYESAQAPDENTFYMCPDLSTVILHDLPTPIELPRQVAKLAVLTTTHVSNQLNKMLSANITHLKLVKCGVTETTIATIASLCVNLRRLQLFSDGLNENVRLRARKQKLFRRLEALEITNSSLAFDILEVAQNICLFDSQPRELKSHLDRCWTGSMLREVLDKNPLEHLESFHLSSTCTANAEGIINFVWACPKLRILGHVQTWAISKKHFEQISQTITTNNLAVKLV